MTGMRIRKAACNDVPQLARVQVDTWRTTYRSFLPEDFLARLTYEWRERMWLGMLCHPERETTAFVAENEAGEVVGFAAGGPNADHPELPYRAELNVIYIRQDYQRRGLGRQLFHRVAVELRQKGYDTLLLWVFDLNRGARRFYESLGGQYLTTKPLTMGPVKADEVAYGWPDIAVLLERLEVRTA